MTGTPTPLKNQDKRLVKRAARLRSRERRETGQCAPLDIWMSRVEGSPDGDLIDGFKCRNCGHRATWQGAGSRHRNHCPNCLHSVHLDIEPGDRAAECGGLMEPVAVWVRGKGEWAVIHRCKECGSLSSNRIAADDNETLLMSMAVRPLAMPAWPLERVPTTEPVEER